MIRRFFSLFAMLAWVVSPQPGSCQSSAANSTEPRRNIAAASQTEVADTTKAVEAIVDKTNGFRRENGQEKLAVNSKLTLAAHHFAEFMAANGKYGHDADGRHADERAAKDGYASCIIGENIAYLYDPAGFTTQRLADDLFEGWKKSPDHRRNMLDPDVTDIGMGIARSEVNGYYYAVQLFGRPKSLAITFEINNKSNAALAYKIGGKKFSLSAKSQQTCEICRPDTLIIDFPSDKKHNLTTLTKTLKPATGDHVVITNGDEGFQIDKETGPSSEIKKSER